MNKRLRCPECKENTLSISGGFSNVTGGDWFVSCENSDCEYSEILKSHSFDDWVHKFMSILEALK